MAAAENIPTTTDNPLHLIYLCALVMLRLKHPQEYDDLIAAPGKKKVWDAIKNQHQISTVKFDAIDEYFAAADNDQDGLRSIAYDLENSADEHFPAQVSPEKRLQWSIYASCARYHQIFVKYPQWVELTETIS